MMASPQPVPGTSRLDRSGLSWAIFQGGRDVYVSLVTIYLFLPYFVSTVIGDSIKGQVLVSRWSMGAAFVTMATAPVLGAATDRLGGRKVWLAVIVAMIAPLMASLWWVGPHGPITATYALLVIAGISVLFSQMEVLHNSMLVQAAGSTRTHQASGLGSGLSNAVSVVVLLVCLWAFVLPVQMKGWWLPVNPLLGLDSSKFEPQRLAGPISAGLLVIALAPLLLFSRDAAATNTSFSHAVSDGVKDLAKLVKVLPQRRNIAIYLVSRMFFMDAMNAFLLYIGIYASGVMRWNSTEMLIFGLAFGTFAAAGGIVGPMLDSRVGPRDALRIEIAATLAALVFLVGLAPDHVLFTFATQPGRAVWNGPVFRTLPELCFLASALFAATAVVAHFASSRTLLTRLTPPGQSGIYFGLFALSGTSTLWLGSLAVSLGTAAFHSQQAGFGSVALLMLLGLVGLSQVQDGAGHLDV